MTIEKCIKFCSNGGYAFAGVESEDACYCGNNAPSQNPLTDSECNAKCIGDKTQICGGHWKISIYSVETCPSSHKYAFLNGKYCCQTNKEKKDILKHGALCDGSRIGINSHCCENDNYQRCSYENCYNHKDAGNFKYEL